MMPNGRHKGKTMHAVVPGQRARQIVSCLFWLAVSLCFIFAGNGLLLQLTGFALIAGAAAEIRRLAGTGHFA